MSIIYIYNILTLVGQQSIERETAKISLAKTLLIELD